MKYFLLWVLCASLLDFALMGVDKWKARHDRWRVPERAFFCVALLGGTPGALLCSSPWARGLRYVFFDLRCAGKAAPPLGGAAFFHGFFPSLCLVPSGSTI